MIIQDSSVCLSVVDHEKGRLINSAGQEVSDMGLICLCSYSWMLYKQAKSQQMNLEAVAPLYLEKKHQQSLSRFYVIRR